MQYAPYEMKTSEEQLGKVFKLLRKPACLLGGWAVYQIVNANFEKAHGRPYIGSRDIDIGFHIDKDWTEKQLRESPFVSALEAIEKIGFKSVSFRLVKDFDIDTGKELTPEESAKLPLFRVFQLFIDPIVDYIHPKTKDLLGFVPIDEPLLSLLFQHNVYNHDYLPKKGHVTKIRGAPGNEAHISPPKGQRTQENKRHS